MFKIYILLGKLGTALSTQPRKVVGQLARAHEHFTILCWAVQELRRFKVIYGIRYLELSHWIKCRI